MQYTYFDLKTRYPFHCRNHPKRPPGRPCCICIYIHTYILMCIYNKDICTHAVYIL